MPQYPFVQVMAVIGVAAIVLAGLAIPVGAKVGARAGLLALRASLFGALAVFAACLVWGAASGDLASFNAQAEPGALVQLGVFFTIMYSVAHRFAGAYLRDKTKEAVHA